ncbi:MAG TPA: HD domain-containing protein [Candidatus Saccharimonadales bacterium]|nr:HD domain-containing protein [Candidatus Saccharimonadales bacterium]
MLTVPQIEELHRKYAPNDAVYNLVYGHCQVVNEIAQWCVSNLPANEEVDIDLLTNAALLHDIGTYVLFDDDGKVTNKRLYPLHAIFGAKIIADEGVDSHVAQIVETHVLLGLSEKEISEKPWPLPARDYIPGNIEGELLCYADRFHTKKPTFNSYDVFLARLRDGMPGQAAKFEAWSKRFGLPDIEALAKKYGQPIDGGIVVA